MSPPPEPWERPVLGTALFLLGMAVWLNMAGCEALCRAALILGATLLVVPAIVHLWAQSQDELGDGPD